MDCAGLPFYTGTFILNKSANKSVSKKISEIFIEKFVLIQKKH